MKLTNAVETIIAEDSGASLHKCITVDISYAAPQAHKIVNVALHQVYSLGIVFIFSQGRKDLYHV
jgi:hypothetical protein